MMRFFSVLLAGFALLILQSGIMDCVPWHIPNPALGLLAVVHAGTTAAFGVRQTVILAFLIGYLADLVTGAPRGTHALVFVLVALIVLRLRQRLSLRATTGRLILGFLFALLAAFGTVLVHSVVLSSFDATGLRQAPLEALTTAFFAVPVLWLLQRLDQRFDQHRTRLGFVRREKAPLISGRQDR